MKLVAAIANSASPIQADLQRRGRGDQISILQLRQRAARLVNVNLPARLLQICSVGVSSSGVISGMNVHLIR